MKPTITVSMQIVLAAFGSTVVTDIGAKPLLNQ